MSEGRDGKVGNYWLSQQLRIFAEAVESGRFLGNVWIWGRRLTVCLTCLYGAALFLLCLAMQWVGERNVTTVFFLYLPPLIWFFPFAPLVMMGGLFHRGSLLVQGAILALAVWTWLGFHWQAEKPVIGASGDILTVMTYNRGQNMNQSLQPFKNANHPDVLVFQEAGGRAGGFLRSPDYAEFEYGVSIGEFTLLSRYPIKANSLIKEAGSDRPARVARFVIDWNGRSVSIYAVHLMTPRDVLRSYMRGAFLWGVLGVPGTPWAEKRRYYQSFWDGQIADAKAILDEVRSDSNTCIVAGDFNAPQTGYLHRMVTRELKDAHAAAGNGFGFTFPGVTRNPLSFGGPWMRIDYIFYDRQWEALECVTERDRPSQHRAVVAKLQLTSGAQLK